MLVTLCGPTFPRLLQNVRRYSARSSDLRHLVRHASSEPTRLLVCAKGH